MTERGGGRGGGQHQASACPWGRKQRRAAPQRAERSQRDCGGQAQTASVPLGPHPNGPDSSLCCIHIHYFWEGNFSPIDATSVLLGGGVCSKLLCPVARCSSVQL